jgi:UDP-N-acetylmuramoyl-tripeptide--D-alanyl-D-alanine ligase
MRRISIDSRTIQPGDYFIPIKGPSFDGRDFIGDAIQKGGVLLDVELSSYAKKYRKKLTSHVIAVVGSAGKTTVKELLSTVLSQRYSVVKTHENENNEIGVPLTIIKADAMTEVLIIEMGIRHLGEMEQLVQWVRPTHVVITGIGMSHIALFGTQKTIATAKAEVFRPPLKWERRMRPAYINYNSPFYTLLQKKATRAGYTVYPYSGENKPDENVNLCYLVGRQFGLSNLEIQTGITQYQPAAHRLVTQMIGEYKVIDDSYNANPDGVQYALQYLKQFSGRKLLVLGDMLELGVYSTDAHRNLLPDIIDAAVSIVFTVGQETKKLTSTDISIYHFSTKEQLHDAIVNELKPADVVLIKGSRAMKMETCIEAIQSHVNTH